MSYYVGFAPGKKYCYILQKGTHKILAVSYDVRNAKLIVEALNKFPAAKIKPKKKTRKK
jgi:hypothetical protein